MTVGAPGALLSSGLLCPTTMNAPCRNPSGRAAPARQASSTRPRGTACGIRGDLLPALVLGLLIAPGFWGCLPVLALPDAFRLSSDCPSGSRSLGRGRCEQKIAYNRPGLRHTGLVQPIATQPYRARVADLGRLLFFDPILSESGRMSCADCHNPQSGWSDGQAVSRGRGAIGSGPARRGGKALPRGAPGLWNVWLQERLFWDGRARTLENQAEGPLFHPDEMHTTRAALERRLGRNATYRRLFRQAYGRRGARISTKLVLEALASFEKTLVSFDSRYDRFALGDRSALSPQELHGFNVYRSFVARCSECHPPPLFTNQQEAVIGAPDRGAFDPGVQAIGGSPLMRGAFRVPSIRNVGLTAPYMHSGALTTLPDVVEFYDDGGGRGLSAPYSKLRIHWHVRPMGLSDQEKLALVAFLHTLTDESAMPAIPSKVPSGSPILNGGNR